MFMNILLELRSVLYLKLHRSAMANQARLMNWQGSYAGKDAKATMGLRRKSTWTIMRSAMNGEHEGVTESGFHGCQYSDQPPLVKWLQGTIHFLALIPLIHWLHALCSEGKRLSPWQSRLMHFPPPPSLSPPHPQQVKDWCIVSAWVFLIASWIVVEGEGVLGGEK